MIYVRTNANELVGAGHVMRCVTVSRQLKKLGEQSVFIIRDEDAKRILPESICAVQLKNCLDMDNELQEMQEIMAVYGPGKILLDSYEFHKRYMSELRRFFEKVITFDDMYAEKFPADMLINYNIFYKRFDYSERYRGSGTKLLLGGAYVPLREQFQDLRLVRRETVKNILLICGGGDPLGFLVKVVQKICEADLYKTYHFIVVCGALNSDIDVLNGYGRKYPEIEVLRDVHNMAGALQNADIVVSAASTVLYECCCVGVPTIFFTVADNQKYDMEAFSENGMMLYAGDFSKEGMTVVDNIFSQIEQLSVDQERMMFMTNRMRKVVDGKGAERIAKEISVL